MPDKVDKMDEIEDALPGQRQSDARPPRSPEAGRRRGRDDARGTGRGRAGTGSGLTRKPGIPRVHTRSGYKTPPGRLASNGPMDDSSRKIVGFVTEFTESKLTEPIVKAFNRTMLDSMASIISGFDEEPVRIAARVAGDAQPGPGRMKSTVFGYGISTTPELAAFANGVHGPDDRFQRQRPRIPATSFRGVLAVGEALHSTGAR